MSFYQSKCFGFDVLLSICFVWAFMVTFNSATLLSRKRSKHCKLRVKIRENKIQIIQERKKIQPKREEYRSEKKNEEKAKRKKCLSKWIGMKELWYDARCEKDQQRFLAKEEKSCCSFNFTNKQNGLTHWSVSS